MCQCSECALIVVVLNTEGRAEDYISSLGARRKRITIGVCKCPKVARSIRQHLDYIESPKTENLMMHER